MTIENYTDIIRLITFARVYMHDNMQCKSWLDMVSSNMPSDYLEKYKALYKRSGDLLRMLNRTRAKKI